ncbi:hypothetical protein K3G63_00695 [Hymenobacter sp. HSC-4F20]|uniref:hypothetical protein n=1 Tax=Hymenobacter sp. HSC-4F20 TaxID=2864135 RepID=UPI001C72EDFD|nr:hypothetical protein [Hymenobacter sp. HSC-4F20]MBX0288932.1 hypothetical protein [Hymenobacter sp. HSC-4F20]
MKNIILRLAILCSLLGARVCFSQNASSDSTTNDHLTAIRRVNSQLYNGPEYANMLAASMQGHPFFLSNQEQIGSIRYNDGTYSQVPLQYDIYHDQVVITHPTSSLKIKLINEKIDSFTIANHPFIRITHDSSQSSALQAGFYEILLRNQLTIVAKRSKHLRETHHQRAVIKTFDSVSSLYLYDGHSYHEITGERSFTASFKQHKSALHKYAATHKLKFTRASREQDTIELARYYLTLIH